ncbi:MAG: hypothetical protein WCS56_00785 [Bacilli bacterium]
MKTKRIIHEITLLLEPVLIIIYRLTIADYKDGILIYLLVFMVLSIIFSISASLYDIFGTNAKLVTYVKLVTLIFDIVLFLYLLFMLITNNDSSNPILLIISLVILSVIPIIDIFMLCQLLKFRYKTISFRYIINSGVLYFILLDGLVIYLIRLVKKANMQYQILAIMIWSIILLSIATIRLYFYPSKNINKEKEIDFDTLENQKDKYDFGWNYVGIALAFIILIFATVGFLVNEYADFIFFQVGINIFLFIMCFAFINMEDKVESYNERIMLFNKAKKVNELAKKVDELEKELSKYQKKL